MSAPPIPSEEEFLSFFDIFMKTKHFLFIFPLKSAALIFLALYTLFFGFFALQIIFGFIAGLDSSIIASTYNGYQLFFYSNSAFLCAASFFDQKAIRSAFMCVYLHKFYCWYRILSLIYKSNGVHGFHVYEYFLDEMYIHFEAFQVGPVMRYFLYFMFIVSAFLGWHISAVMFSYHRESWIPINENLEVNVPDYYIKPTAKIQKNLKNIFPLKSNERKRIMSIIVLQQKKQ